MRKTTKLIALSLGIAVLVGVLGIGAAFAATPTPTASSNYHDVFVSKLAAALGITDQEKVANALMTARDQAIDQAVTDGRITQQQADWMKQHKQQMQQGGFGPGMMDDGPMHGGRMGSAFGGPWGAPSQIAPSAPNTQ